MLGEVLVPEHLAGPFQRGADAVGADVALGGATRWIRTASREPERRPWGVQEVLPRRFRSSALARLRCGIGSRTAPMSSMSSSSIGMISSALQSEYDEECARLTALAGDVVAHYRAELHRCRASVPVTALRRSIGPEVER